MRAQLGHLISAPTLSTVGLEALAAGGGGEIGPRAELAEALAADAPGDTGRAA